MDRQPKVELYVILTITQLPHMHFGLPLTSTWYHSTSVGVSPEAFLLLLLLQRHLYDNSL
jgi:hypothetical protein